MSRFTVQLNRLNAAAPQYDANPVLSVLHAEILTYFNKQLRVDDKNRELLDTVMFFSRAQVTSSQSNQYIIAVQLHRFFRDNILAALHISVDPLTGSDAKAALDHIRQDNASRKLTQKDHARNGRLSALNVSDMRKYDDTRMLINAYELITSILKSEGELVATSYPHHRGESVDASKYFTKTFILGGYLVTVWI